MWKLCPYSSYLEQNDDDDGIQRVFVGLFPTFNASVSTSVPLSFIFAASFALEAGPAGLRPNVTVHI